MSYRGSNKIIKARKRHRCNWCGEWIDKDSKYAIQFIAHEESVWQSKMHVECKEAELKFDWDQVDGTLYYEGQFQRGHLHLPNEFSTIEEGIKNNCPGCIKIYNDRKNK